MSRRSDPLLSNLATLGGARSAVLCMNLITTSHLAKVLGAENFGLNSFAFSYVAYFMIVVNLGYETFVAREIAFNPARREKLADSMLTVRLILAGIMSALLVCTLPLLHLTTTARVVLLIQGINIFSSAFGLTTIYQGLQRMGVVAQREFMASAAAMIGTLLLVHRPGDVVLAAAVSAATMLVSNSMIFARYASDYGLPRLHLTGRFDLEQARSSLAYFWSVLMITITYNIHIVLLGLMRDATEVGFFSAGWKLFNFAVVLPNLVSTLFLPRIAAVTANPLARAHLSTTYMQLCMVFGIPIALIGEALVPQILSVLFGPAYLPAAPIASLLLLNALVVTLNIGFGTPLLAVGRQTTFLLAVGCATVAGVVLCVALIPRFGAEGAALATLANETVLLGLFIAVGPEVRPGAMVEFGLRCVLAVAPAAVIANAAGHLIGKSSFVSLLVAGSAGGISYLVLLRLLRIDLLHLATG